MSLIFGINLCDRLYLSGDTRLSQRQEDGALKETKDKIVKVVRFNNNIIGAFAGSAGMSAFIAKKLLESISPELDIRKFREDTQTIIGPIVDQYWKTADSNEKASIVIIFGGLSRSKRKEFNLKEIEDKIQQYSELAGKERIINVKPALLNELTNSNSIQSKHAKPCDSHIFSIQISPPSNWKIEDADWGEYLAYGPKGITKEKLNLITLGMLEFSGGDAIHDNMAITGILNDVADKLIEKTIAKSFVNIIIAESIIGVLAGGVFRANLATMQPEFLSEIFMEDGKFFRRNEDGSMTKLTSIKDYSCFGDLEI